LAFAGQAEAPPQHQVEIAGGWAIEHVAAGVAENAGRTGHERELVKPPVDGRMRQRAAGDAIAAISSSAILWISRVTDSLS
jgi:hypothetical protein